MHDKIFIKHTHTHTYLASKSVSLDELLLKWTKEQAMKITTD